MEYYRSKVRVRFIQHFARGVGGGLRFFLAFVRSFSPLTNGGGLQGTAIVQSRDQDTTDLEKCVLQIKDIEHKKGQMVPLHSHDGAHATVPVGSQREPDRECSPTACTSVHEPVRGGRAGRQLLARARQREHPLQVSPASHLPSLRSQPRTAASFSRTTTGATWNLANSSVLYCTAVARRLSCWCQGGTSFTRT